MARSSSLKNFGGKAYLASWIISMFPPRSEYDHFIETHFCTGAVTFAMQPELYEGCSEIANDIDGDLMNFWRVLQDPVAFNQFRRLVQVAPVSRELWQYARTERPTPVAPDAKLAFQFFVRFRQSREGKGKAFATLTKTRTRRGMQEQVSAFLSSVDGLPESHQRLQRILLENADACDLIRRQDTKRTLYYLDPPYFHATRVSKAVYRYEMTKAEHVTLLDTLSSVKGKFILSAYESNLYSNWAAKHGFFCCKRLIDCKASAKKEKPQRTECLYLNYSPPN